MTAPAIDAPPGAAAGPAAWSAQPWEYTAPNRTALTLTPRSDSHPTDEVSLQVHGPGQSGSVGVLADLRAVSDLLHWLGGPAAMPHQWRDGQTSARFTHLTGGGLEVRTWWNGSGKTRITVLDGDATTGLAVWLSEWVSTSCTPAVLQARLAGQAVPADGPPSPLTAQEQIDALTEALARLTHRPFCWPNPCTDCGLHQDAAVHATPDRVLGVDTGFTPPESSAIDHAEVVIATAVRAVKDREHPGWGHYAPAGRAAALDLIAAGWTPPTAATAADPALAALRRLVALQEERHVASGEVLHRLEADGDAADRFRNVVLGLIMQLQDRLAAEKEATAAGRTFTPLTADTFLRALTKVQESARQAADRTRAKTLAAPQPDIRDYWTGGQQETLFDLSETTAHTLGGGA